MVLDCLPEDGAEELSSIRMGSQIARVTQSSREPHRDHAIAKGPDQTSGGFLARWITVEHDVEPTPSLEQFQALGCHVRPAQSQCRDTQVLERQQIGGTLHKAHPRQIPVGLLPAE